MPSPPPSPEGRLPYKAPWDFAGSSLAKDGQTLQPHPYRPPPWDFSDYEPPPNETKVHGPLHPPKFTPAMLMPPHLKLEVIKTMRAAKYMAIRVSKALPVVEEAAALASTMGTAAHDLVVSNPHAPSAILGTLRALDGCAVDAEAAMSRRSGELRGLLEALHEWQPVLSEHLALLETRCYKPNKIGGRSNSPRRSKSPSSKAGGGGFNLGPSSSDKEEEERKMWGIYSQVRMANEVIEEAHGACISGLKEATQRTKRSNVAKGQIQKASIQVKGEREYVRRQELLYYRLSEAMDAHLEEEAEKEGNAPLLPTEPPPAPSPTTLAAKEGVPRPTPVISPDGCVVWPRRGEPYRAVEWRRSRLWNWAKRDESCQRPLRRWRW